MSPQLLAEMADWEQAALAEADRKFRDIHGDEAEWSDPEWAQYEQLTAKVHRLFHMPVGAL